MHSRVDVFASHACEVKYNKEDDNDEVKDSVTKRKKRILQYSFLRYEGDFHTSSRESKVREWQAEDIGRGSLKRLRAYREPKLYPKETRVESNEQGKRNWDHVAVMMLGR
jgi:hypothetical protein